MDKKSRFLLILAMILLPVLSTFIVRVPLTIAALPNTLSDKIVELLRELELTIQSLPDEAFGGSKKASQYRGALLGIVRTVIKQIEGGALQGALGKLNELADKIKKWVLEPWKTALIEKVTEIIGLLGLYV